MTKVKPVILKRISSISQKEDLEFRDLIRQSIKSQFPIYSLWVLIQARFEQIKIKKTEFETTNNGWVNPTYDAKIKELNEEISRLRKIKLIDFPNIDKKWMRLFTLTAIGASIIVLILFIRGQHYVGKSEKFGYNIEILQEDTTALANMIRAYENEIDKLNMTVYLTRDSVVAYLEQISELKQVIRNKDRLLTRLEDQKKNLTSELTTRDNIIRGLNADKNSLSRENNKLNQEKVDLIRKMQQLDRINFSLGTSAREINNCRNRFTDQERLYFNAYYPVKFHKITVEARRSSLFEFLAYDSNTGRSQRKIIYLNRGRNTVDLDFELGIGNNHYLTFSGGSLIALQDCHSFPFGINNLIRFTRGSGSVYPPFYDIIVSANVQFM